MVRITPLSYAAAMAFALFSSTTAGQAPQPLTPQQVNDTIISMTAQAKAINITAQSISAKTSCFYLGFSGTGPLKKLIVQIQTIDTILNATAASLDADVTPPLNSTTNATESDQIYSQYAAFQSVVRDGLKTIKLRSENITCALTVTLPLFGPITVFNYTAQGTETRQRLVEYKESLGNLRYVIDDYDVRYYNDITENWQWTSGVADDAIAKYDAFKPVGEAPVE